MIIIFKNEKGDTTTGPIDINTYKQHRAGK